MPMDMSQVGLDRLIRREALKLKAYQDSVGVWTIGVGHTAMAGPPKVFKGMVITEQQAREILAHDLVQFEDTVERALKRIHLRQYEFDALVSLCFNIGQVNFTKSSVVRYLRQGDRAKAANAFRLWNKGGKPRRVIKGLVNRREDERAQFLGE
jgi:lysozyme